MLLITLNHGYEQGLKQIGSLRMLLGGLAHAHFLAASVRRRHSHGQPTASFLTSGSAPCLLLRERPRRSRGPSSVMNWRLRGLFGSAFDDNLPYRQSRLSVERAALTGLRRRRRAWLQS
jgi:hypothetical protein